ncbi:MAG: arginine--tRNA ligase, partial [Candidatus Aminicenantes bacterium]|nr:arginine--tRNA ligase [Candidatus Aminicenantes bacterium]
MIKLKKYIKENIKEKLKSEYPIEPSMLEITYTPQLKMGDLALTFPFQLSKKMNRKPRDLALEVIPLLSSLEGVEKIDVA